MVLLGVVSLSQSLVYGSSLSLKYDGSTHVYDKTPITLYVNNMEVISEVMPPVQIEGYVLVPIREVFQALGATVQWKSSERKVCIEKDNSLIVLELNNKDAWVNGEIKEMEIAPKEINEKVMVPIRFISEALGYKVAWLNNERSVHINEQTSIIQSNSNINQDFSNNQIISDEISQNNNMSYMNEINSIFPFLNYDSIAQKMTISDGGAGISVSDITVNDNYTKRKMTFTINNSALEDVKPGSWKGKIGYLKAVNVTKTNSGAQITVETSSVCAVDLSKGQDGIVINFMKPNQKYNKIIVVDPGHGGADDGTRCNGVKEKDITLRCGKALFNLLEADNNIKVI